MHQEIKNKILTQIVDLNIDKYDYIIDQLESLGEFCVFGGAIRDWLTDHEPKDIDIVVDCSLEDLDKFLEKYSPRKNSFGGSKIFINGMKFDFWNVGSTWVYKNDSSFDITLENLPNTSFFNLDAAIYKYKTKSFHENGFCDALRYKVLDIIYQPNLFPKYVTSKALIMASKYNLNLSVKLKKYILNLLESEYAEKDFNAYQKLNYKKNIYDFNDCLKKVNITWNGNR